MTAPSRRQPDGIFARSYGVVLLFNERPLPDSASLVEAVQRRLPGCELMRPAKDALAFVHPAHGVLCNDGAVPARTLILKTDDLLDPATLEQPLQQSWSWLEASNAVRDARHMLLLSDLMSSGLPCKERLRLFQGVLAGVVDMLPCAGIHWREAGQIVSPGAFLAAVDEHGLQFPLPGAVNVRFYRIMGSDKADGGDIIMDTLGLGALGLVDIQCHFRGLDPGEVSRVLFGLALHIYDAGPRFENGHTVQGITAAQKWTVNFEESIVAPKRPVLDLTPHAPHAAGR